MKREIPQNNFDTTNIESIEKNLKSGIKQGYGMFVDESGKGDVHISEKSREICVETLLR